MRRVLRILAQPRHYWWITLVLAALVLLARLGSYGFWEPREIGVAESASSYLERQAAEHEPAAPAPAPAARPGAAAPPASGARPSAAHRLTPTPTAPPRSVPEPPLTERLVAFGIDHLGFDERGARAPLALLGLLAVMAVFVLGTRLSSPRAGLIGAVAMLSFPLVLLESRQLTSDIGAITGTTLMVTGLVGLALPARHRDLAAGGTRQQVALSLVIVDLLAVAAGAYLANAAAGPLLGLMPPLAAFGLGVLVHLGVDHGDSTGADPGDRDVTGLFSPGFFVGALALIAGVVALSWFMHRTFDLVDSREGLTGLTLFGKTLHPASVAAPGLGAPWRARGDVQTPFTALFEPISFGIYPWVALAPLALIALALGLGPRAPRDRQPPGAPWAGAVLFCWAALAWLVATIVMRKVTRDVEYPALGAIAAAIGIWLDRLLAAREAAAPAQAPGGGAADGADAPGSLPLWALFALLSVVVVGKDLKAMPDKMTSLTTSGQSVKFPAGSHLQLGVLGIGILFGVCLFAGLFFWRGPYAIRWRVRGREVLADAGRYGVHAAVAVAVLFALFLSQVWVPGLSQKMSSRDVLAAYRTLRHKGDQLGILASLGSGPRYYARGPYTTLKDRQDLISFLAKPGRVFALTRSNERCTLRKQAVDKGFHFYEVDDSSAQYALLSNRLGPGEVDHNPLVKAVQRTRPADVGASLSINLDNQIELIGVKMPAAVDRGDRFQMTLYYHVLAPLKRPWKVFVHLDTAGAATHIIGDHALLGGLCPLNYLQPGDYVVDTFPVTAGGMSYPRGIYKVWTGLFVGSNPNWTNIKALSGNPDKANRVPIGTIRIK